MFLHNFKYTFLVIVKGKITLFWTLVFPILLATFMYIAFGNIVNNTEMFKHIPVAIVEDGSSGEGLKTMVDMLSEESDDQLFESTYMNEEDAKKALQDNEIAGIIFLKDASLMVNESSTNATIIEMVLREYKQYEHLFMDMFSSQTQINPAEIEKIVGNVTEQASFVKEEAATEGDMNNFNNYFFAIFAMSCLFAGLSSIGTMNNLQANISARGMRRGLSPNNKFNFILSEFTALTIIHFVVEVIALGYMKLIGVEFSEKLGCIFSILIVGCVIGLAIGVIIGSIAKLSEGGKIGILISISMALSVCADLCAAGVKHMLEEHLPIVNRLNPAALLSDSFYALSVYDDYTVFSRNLITMVIEAAVLLFCGYMMIRRNKYASV